MLSGLHMSDFEKTKDNIRITELSEGDRKHLFKKFTDAGGEVIKDKKRPVSVKIDRERQREFVRKLDQKQKTFQKQYQQKLENRKQQHSSTSKKKEHSLAHFLDKRIIRFRLYLLSVTDFAGQHLHQKFFEHFNNEYKNAMIEIQLLYLDIFKQNPVLGEAITEQLDKVNPLYFELIEMAADLFDRTLTNEIIDRYQMFPNAPERATNYRDPLLAYFKRIYVLHKFQDAIFTGFEKAINLQKKREKKSSSVYSTKRKKIKNSLYIIFHRFFPRLYWLFCLFHGQIVPLSHRPEIDQLLMIGPDLKPGNRVPHAPSMLGPDLTRITPAKMQPQQTEEETEEEAPDEQEATPKKQKVKIPVDVQKGLTLMSQVNMDKLTRECISDEIIRKLATKDNIITAFLLFNEFDREYSFILTTNKIKYQTFYDHNGKIDYKTKFSDLYNTMRGCQEAFKEYFLSIQIFEKARAERPRSNEQYFHYSKRLTELEKNKKAKAQAAVKTLQSFFETISKDLQFLVNDINKEGQIVTNANDIIEFDPDLEGNKKLSGKKVFQAITYAYYFTTAFLYRLSQGEDLAVDIGSHEKLSEHQIISKTTKGYSLGQEKQLTEIQKPSLEKQTSTDDDQSILDELDDLV
jgi:hypothetical protein